MANIIAGWIISSLCFGGGLGLLGFAGATHVTAAHLELPAIRDGRAPIVAVVGGAVLAAMVGRVMADVTGTYFEHLTWAGGIWIALSATAIGLGIAIPFYFFTSWIESRIDRERAAMDTAILTIVYGPGVDLANQARTGLVAQPPVQPQAMTVGL